MNIDVSSFDFVLPVPVNTLQVGTGGTIVVKQVHPRNEWVTYEVDDDGAVEGWIIAVRKEGTTAGNITADIG